MTGGGGGAERRRKPFGSALDHGGGTDVARGAGAVVDDHRLAPLLLQALADVPRQEVRAAAGRKRHDDADGLGRPFLSRDRKAQNSSQDGEERAHGLIIMSRCSSEAGPPKEIGNA